MWQTDNEWVERCLDGHPDGFRHLIQRHQGPLLGFLMGRLGSEEDAAEAAQETFVRAYFALRKLRTPASFFSWLVGIADRVVKETRRAERRRRVLHAQHGQPRVSDAPASDDCLPAVTQAVGRLPEAYREVVLLRFYGGLSCAEVARQLEIPLGTVTKQLSRAYALLREMLQQQSEADMEVQA